MTRSLALSPAVLATERRTLAQACAVISQIDDKTAVFPRFANDPTMFAAFFVRASQKLTCLRDLYDIYTRLQIFSKRRGGALHLWDYRISAHEPRGHSPCDAYFIQY